jgi:hypothetical protein
MGRQLVPHQRGLAREQAAQLAKDLDEGVGVVVASRVVNAALGAATAHPIAQPGRHGGPFPR